MNKKLKRTLVLTAAVILAAAIGIGIYMGDYYHAEATAAAAMAGTEAVPVQTEGSLTWFGSETASTGFIFYPGGKVEHAAYAPLLLELAQSNILCVLVEMPGNLAVLNQNAAEKIPALFPEVTRWYIGGHSLGGSMAASYATGHREELAGLVLLAAYSTADLSAADLPVLSLYGTEDGVLDLEKYEQYRPNLPQDMTEMPLSGGNHAGFGSYGAQDGDGAAAISPEEQRRLTVEQLLAFFGT